MARAEDRERLLSAGCNEYVTKPYVVDDLEVLLSLLAFPQSVNLYITLCSICQLILQKIDEKNVVIV